MLSLSLFLSLSGLSAAPSFAQPRLVTGCQFIGGGGATTGSFLHWRSTEGKERPSLAASSASAPLLPPPPPPSLLLLPLLDPPSPARICLLFLLRELFLELGGGGEITTSQLAKLAADPRQGVRRRGGKKEGREF
ncbi:hypothetical protein JOB18_040484 [Solea senegalensis]|uniref:Secreted protein n=1 Tax=Solea senegalensis TaxID=28829 RepID=A0AAV6TAK1_SOLSE|nr:hypothetical protein JOB18_040484 [Solea senegalensis]